MALQTYIQLYVHLVTEVVVVLSMSSRKARTGRLDDCTSMGARLAEWASSNPHYSLRTRLICNSQRGFTRGHNRNLGARACRSNWLAYLDADDEMQPDRVERMLGLLDRHAWVKRGEAKRPRREGSHKGGESDCSEKSDRTRSRPQDERRTLLRGSRGDSVPARENGCPSGTGIGRRS